MSTHTRGEITAEGALARASRASQVDGRIRHVMATAYGWTITLRRVPFQGCYYTNGRECGYWEAYKPYGSDDRVLTHRVDRILGITRCPDCGEAWKQMGHEACGYPARQACRG